MHRRSSRNCENCGSELTITTMTSGLTLELTVAAVIERQNKFLMVEELVHGRHVINQPAGHVEPGESPLEAVMREMLEETAWHFQPDAITGIYLWPHPDQARHFLRVSFCGSCHDHEPERTLDEGIIRATWFSRAKLLARSLQLRTPMVMRSIDDYLAGNRLPCDTIVQLPTNELAERAALVG